MTSKWVDRMGREVRAPRGAEARAIAGMIGKEKFREMQGYRPKRLTAEQQEARDSLRAGEHHEQREWIDTGLQVPAAIRELQRRKSNFDSYAVDKPWMQNSPDSEAWPILQRPDGKYIGFLPVKYDRMGDATLASVQSFIDYAEVYVSSDRHPASTALMQAWLAQAKGLIEAQEQKQISREISNQNLELSDYRDPESPVQAAAKASKITKTVRFDKGFISDCAAQERSPKYFTAFELGTLSKAQTERIQRMSEVLGVSVLTKRLPALGDSDANKYAMLNIFLNCQARYYGIVNLIASAGTGIKSYEDDDAKKRSLGSNRLVGDFDPEAVQSDD